MVAVNQFDEIEALARQGDLRAFARLIRAWDNDLRGVAWSVSRSAVHTDDIMQATYEKAIGALKDFRGDSSLKTWLHTICYRTAVDHVRFEGRRSHEDPTVLDTWTTSGSTSDEALANIELSDLLAALDPHVRTALMLTTGLGYSFDEAATILDMPRGTVASHVRRAKHMLQRTADTQTPNTEMQESGE